MLNNGLPTTIQEEYKDHTVSNPVNSIKESDLPLNARGVHMQPIRNLDITIQVLDEKTEKVIETITGKANGGNIRLDSSSLTRRTGSINFSFDPDLFPREGSLIWFGRIVRIYAGLKDLTLQNHVVNFLLGTFWIDDGDISVSDSGSEISISISDKMTMYDGKQLEYPMAIPVDTPISEAIKAVMENAGETSFGDIIQPDLNMVVPYKLEYGAGEDIINIITALRDMYMDCYCGFDNMGRFEFKQLKVQKFDEVSDPKWRFDSTSNDRADLSLSFKESYNMKSIRNHIVVYGGTSERTGITPVGEVKITDTKSPFNVDAIGTRKKIIVEDKYVTNDQCVAMARYDIWKSSTFQEVANITSLPIYILDANDILEITNPETKEVSRYMLDSFDLGLDIDASMSISAHKLYYVGLEYGKKMIPIVENFIRGINNWGWLSLAEERINDCYNMMGSGKGQLTVRFADGELGGEQASVTSYATSKTQTMKIDVKDFEGLLPTSESGDNGRSKGDYADRVLGHEMFHAVMNDYLGHDMAIELPVWFKESWAEFIHGAKERFELSYPLKTEAEKRTVLTELCSSVLNGAWTSTSEEYVASYLIAIAIYRLASKDQWTNLFIRLRNQKNVSINFLLKLLPIAETNDGVKDKIIAEIKSMENIWAMLYNKEDNDTGSIGGVHFMNLYGVPLTAENVFNNSNATTDSIGFRVQIEK